ncbi:MULTISPECIES: DAK2 domain-containing protein [unclassified Carboxylicivirga]|uniref:DAK2 domain-containing protein n=1 Tax=Carboxylicivirga TaxID=1628153 RepID=UPI003D34F4DA
MEKLTIDTFKSMVNNALQNITDRADELSKLDAIAGDGDHGTAIVAALNAVKKASESGKEFKAMLTDMAFSAMQEACGSTSTLIGAFFLGLSDGAEGAELEASQVKTMFAAGLTNVQKQTQAKVGDKTMMDALIPAVKSIQAAEGDVKAIIESGAKAAQEGAKKTVDMQAAFGRARNLGERSIGHADPGATSWACMFASFAETLA